MTRRKLLAAMFGFGLASIATVADAQRGPRPPPPKPPKRIPCPTCYGTGQIVISGGQSRRCPRCNGKGFLTG